jgi:hypothetical protein
LLLRSRLVEGERMVDDVMSSGTSPSIIGKSLNVISLGISTFADDLGKQGVKVLRVDWAPPAGGDEEMLKLLDKLGF